MGMLTKEITDNSNKFSRWTIQSILDGVSKMRFNFIQRQDGSTTTHKVVGTSSVATFAFAKQINLNVPNCWAVLKDVLETVQSQEDQVGEYLYVKEPNQINYRMMKMTEDDISE